MQNTISELFTYSIAKEEVDELKSLNMEVLEDIASRYQMKLEQVTKMFKKSHPELAAGKLK
jgi:hypothetical protein